MPSHTHLFPGDDQLRLAFNIQPVEILNNWDWTGGSDNDSNGWYNTTPTGNSQPHNNLPPYIALYWIMYMK